MFLVCLEHTMDDIHVRLFADRDDAFEFAKRLDIYDTVPDTWRNEGSTPLGVSVYEFDPQTGLPVGYENVKWES